MSYQSPSPGVQSPSHSGRGSAQLRLLNAAAAASERIGAADITVDDVLELAKTSRASFYQYHTSLTDWFQASYRHHADLTFAKVYNAVNNAKHPERAVVEALVDHALEETASAWLLMVEGLAAGPTVIDERQALIARIEQTVRTASSPVEVGLPLGVFIGALFRFLAMRLLDGSIADTNRADITQWMDAFSSPPAPQLLLVETQSTNNAEDVQMPQPMRLTSRALDSSSRERILEAAILTVAARSYPQTTVADIVALAGVSRRTFYDEFPSKSAAVITAYEQGFQEALAHCTPAFFGPTEWPERVWDSSVAFAKFFASRPSLAYLGFVDCYALGRAFTVRVNATQLAFTLFLEEGYHQHSRRVQLSRASSVLTAATIAEIAFKATRSRSSLRILSTQPLAVHVVLTPFLGAADAGEFVAAKPTTRIHGD
jgi:AcrR family transcriptional regulator